MKNKKLFVLTSAVLSTVLFASCSGGSSTSFNANWYANTAINTVVEGTNETLTYAISLKEDSGYNPTYSIAHADGTYTAVLSAETREGKLFYSYQTTLKISTQFAFGSETSELFNDTVTSKVLFKDTKSGLQPIWSEKKVDSHAPASLTPKSLENCYKHLNYSFVIDYDKENCKSGTSAYTDLLKETPEETKTDFSIDDKYSYIDNEEILFAVRGVTLTGAQQIQTYNASIKQVQPVKISPSAEESDEFSFVLNGESVKKAIAYYPVGISLAVTNPGSTQTAWYAKTTDINANAYRNVMLRLEMPFSYNLETLVFSLASADFANV